MKLDVGGVERHAASTSRQEGERRYGFGWRLSQRPGEALELDLGAWRRERDAARPEHGVSLDLRLRW